MVDATTHLNIYLPGTPEIRVSGTALTPNHLKARALLFYLAASDQPHTRQHYEAIQGILRKTRFLINVSEEIRL